MGSVSLCEISGCLPTEVIEYSLFVSPIINEGLIGTAAFRMIWNSWETFTLFPPVRMLSQVVLQLGSYATWLY